MIRRKRRHGSAALAGLDNSGRSHPSPSVQLERE